MVLQKRKAAGSKPIRSRPSSPQEPAARIQEGYRGGKIAGANTPVYIQDRKEIYIAPNNPLDQAVLAYFEQKGYKAVGEEKGRVITLSQIKNLRLDHLLNLERKTEDPIFEENGGIGIAKCLPADGVGIAILGREGYWYPSKEDFNDLYTKDVQDADIKATTTEERGRLEQQKEQRQKFEENFNDKLDEFVDNVLKEDPEEEKAFREAYRKKTGKPLNINLDEIKSSLTDDTKKAGFIGISCGYLYPQLAKLTPTTESVLQNPNKLISLDYVADTGATLYRFDEKTKLWKAQGFFYVLEKDGKKTLYYADPFSSSGSTVMLIGRMRGELIPVLQKELELDKTDKYLVRNAGNGNLEDAVKEAPAGSIVSMIREDNSPITHLPLFDLFSEKKELAVVSVGTVDPYTNRQSNSFVVSNREAE